MSKIFVFVAFFFVVAVFVAPAAAAVRTGRASSQETAQRAASGGSQRVRRQAMTPSLGNYPLGDTDLLQPIFRTPLKRQWCRRGMAYNPVLGSCTFSVAAMRGRGRNHRRH
ncbi:hypothetical protein ACOMHN_048590 [Nucella lapillus]